MSHSKDENDAANCTAVQASWTLPIRLVSEVNVSGSQHWRIRAKRAKDQRHMVRMLIAPALGRLLQTHPFEALARARVHVARIAPRALDSDNLVSCAKHVRDEIAAVLGIDDRDSRVEWLVTQRRGAPKVYAAECQIDLWRMG